MGNVSDLAGSNPVAITERCRRKRGHVAVILCTDTAGWWHIIQAISDGGKVWMGHARPLSNDEMGVYGWAMILWDGSANAVHLEGSGQLNDLLERMAVALTEREEPGSSQAG